MVAQFAMAGVIHDFEVLGMAIVEKPENPHVKFSMAVHRRYGPFLDFKPV
jgi:hypothetical protein